MKYLTKVRTTNLRITELRNWTTENLWVLKNETEWALACRNQGFIQPAWDHQLLGRSLDQMIRKNNGTPRTKKGQDKSRKGCTV